ncbi:hypothetical protein LY474_24365 [Myxococcus stipitatus]|uniref:hypothetical protein n=1 Tax=Myxococcus stipitatus TaxID=83455 RepID=UPI001F37809B|nr:hypothetical protein [Myxococcus stipitatus]MCE9670948.1 hypothetical protein [Myxococcus stipitatus]
MDVPTDPAQAGRQRVRVVQGVGRTKAGYVVDLAEPGQRLIIVASQDSTESDLDVPHFLFSRGGRPRDAGGPHAWMGACGRLGLPGAPVWNILARVHGGRRV